MLQGREQRVGVTEEGRLDGPLRQRLPGREIRADLGGERSSIS
jgi:hypothetical protein